MITPWQRPPARSVHSTPLLEREAQLATIEALIEGALDGDGRLVVIEGSPGLGKTRLLAEARSLARSAGMTVLAARGGELEGTFAYGIVHQLLEPVLATADPDTRAELLSGSARLAAPLFDPSQLAAARSASGERSFVILHGLYWLIANLALQGPTLLAVDDLHWVDPPSLRWLAYVIRRLGAVRLLVIVGTRPLEAQGIKPGVVAELVADPEASRSVPSLSGHAPSLGSRERSMGLSPTIGALANLKERALAGIARARPCGAAATCCSPRLRTTSTGSDRIASGLWSWRDGRSHRGDCLQAARSRFPMRR